MKYIKLNFKFFYCSFRLYTNVNSKNITPLFLKALENEERPAIIDENGLYTYKDIFHKSFKLADNINNLLNLNFKAPISERSICTLFPNNVFYIISMFACWMCKGVFVPLSPAYPPSRLKYFLKDCNAQLLITNKEYSDKFNEIFESDQKQTIMIVDEHDFLCSTHDIDKVQLNIKLNYFKQLQINNKFKDIPSLIVYTSGTTSLPKGVVHTFGSIQSQFEGMISSWKWTQNDVILHALPLHHVHGLINALMTPLYCGALCLMMPSFDAKKIWSYLLDFGHISPRPINIFMGVPTMYAKLILEVPNYSETYKILKTFIKESCLRKIRLFVSGSAPLPINILKDFEKLTGHILLERYGMTETGMILTNPLLGDRQPGAVGMPLKNVEVRIVKLDMNKNHGYNILCTADSKQCTIFEIKEKIEGELHVRGTNLFTEYLNKSSETKKSFTADGWFITGDTAAYREKTFKILGRTSVDIIKSGGFKISALEVEESLIKHPNIAEVAVIGLPDHTWGQKVAALIVLTETTSLTVDELQKWALQYLAKYQIPTSIKIVKAIDKNIMGKVDKKNLINIFKN